MTQCAPTMIADRIARPYPAANLSSSPATKAKREIDHGQNGSRLFATGKSLRPMRQADRLPRMDGGGPAAHLLSLALLGLQLPVRGGGVLRRFQVGSQGPCGPTEVFDGRRVGLRASALGEG